MADWIDQALREELGRIRALHAADDRHRLNVGFAGMDTIGQLLAQIELRDRLIAHMIDPNDCLLDHDGHCQAHNLDGPLPPCPHQAAKDLLGPEWERLLT